ncbi:hypothetical protein ACSBL2_09880 [Pedobacter sp. AW31-3R]|uniref:hypothetical protein n=1 Tax=Pedobacter sp. AW31-3R TaxID=3445781 RepID=UPI003FA0426D
MKTTLKLNQTDTVIPSHQIELDNITKFIAKLPKVELIFCFGQRFFNHTADNIFETENEVQTRMSYDLLIVTSDEVAIQSAIEKWISEKYGITFCATLLIHTRTQFSNALKLNNRFFHEILRKNNLLYRRESAAPLTIEQNFMAEIDYMDTNDYWMERLERAESFLEAAKHILYEDLNVALSLIAQSFEQIYLGIIYVLLAINLLIPASIS